MLDTETRPQPVDTTYRRPIHWRCQHATHAGAVRKLNEDAVFTCADQNHWAVADGMGGHEVGDLASREIVQGLAQLRLPEALAESVDRVEDCLQGVNQGLQNYARMELDGATIGSTLVHLMIRGRIGVVLWAGDSRLYRFRNGALTQLSRDHSQVEDMVAMGLINREQARVHECSNVITRAVGVEEHLQLDMRLFDVQLGDLFLLCSDGLHGVIETETIAGILADRDPGICAQALIDVALRAGAPDNVSVVVIKGEPGKVGSSSGRQCAQRDN
ncbi:protein phosphatase 2C domain-containing protein [Marinimicrobium sp. C6131]|uniref:PP2C family protein-serine/threonine phosphatase n=1 Tax=Marinimicrobium sp. C6131 TaxID=3022676 RepID=UPI00223CA4DA|nr:protein phosphatase 2C domain-containing protein [Marinimicrobium sp. C6131]UZJ44270.1 protein phosphatase 2C domain-containing protein [Marinimicrobium sp. C6131]